MRNLMLLSGFVFLFLVTTSCTRPIENKNTLSLSLPSQSKLSASKLTFAVVNVRAPGAPVRVQRFEFQNSTISPVGAITDAAGDVYLEIKDVPVGSSSLVQLLAVYEDDTTGSEEITYGDATAILQDGDNLLEVVVNRVGSTTRFGEITGRLLSAPGEGPTGTLVMSYDPGSGKPTLDIEEVSIYNGWFSIFALDGEAKLSYRLKSNDQVVLSGISLSSAELQSGAMGAHRVMFNKPNSYRDEYSRGIRFDEETVFVGGYFLTPGSTATLADKQVCFLDYPQAVNRQYTDAAASAPLSYKPTSGTLGVDMVRVNGGVPKTFEQIFSNLDCNTNNPLKMSFNGGGADDNEGGGFGIRGPFRAINPLQQYYSAYVKMAYDGANTIMASWDYLPGVAGKAVSGVSVFAYNRQLFGDNNNNGGGNHSLPCNEQGPQRGFRYALDSVGTTFSFTGNGEVGFVNSSNVHDFSFYICPYIETASGRKYWNDAIEAHCIGDCNDPSSYGWGTQDVTISGLSFHDSPVNGAYGKVTAVVDTGTTLDLTLGGTLGNSFSPGDEVFIHVVGYGSSGNDCGVFEGQSISPGMYNFTRVLSTTSALKIPKGTFMDGVLGKTTELATASLVPSANFCHIQAVKVPHFRNVTINSGGLTANVFPFTDGTPGGVVAMRISGKLVLNDNIDVTGRGLPGGISTSEFGGGVFGGNQSSNSTYSGGHAGYWGGGGAGAYGQGSSAASGTVLGGSAISGGQGWVIPRFGSGGGYSDSPNNLAGTSGGGIIFVASRFVDVGTSGVGILANGVDASGSDGAGGGGGSVVLYSQEIKSASAGSLYVEAEGGDGNGSAGGGGGGYVKVSACNTNNLVTVYNNAGTGGDNTGTNGNPDIFDTSNTNWHCQGN